MTQAFVEVITLQRWKKNSCLCNEPPRKFWKSNRIFTQTFLWMIFFGKINIKQNNVMFEWLFWGVWTSQLLSYCRCVFFGWFYFFTLAFPNRNPFQAMVSTGGPPSLPLVISSLDASSYSAALGWGCFHVQTRESLLHFLGFWGAQSMTHRIHGTGIFTYITCAIKINHSCR